MRVGPHERERLDDQLAAGLAGPHRRDERAPAQEAGHHVERRVVAPLEVIEQHRRCSPGP